MVAKPNLDLLEWFDPAERELCEACGERALVGAEGAPLFRVCLGCAAVWVAGERIDSLRLLNQWPPKRQPPK
jgi:hypothetical protein